MPISPNSLTITAIAAAVLFGEDAVEQRRLAGAEIAGDDGDGNFVGQRFFSSRGAFRGQMVWGGRHCEERSDDAIQKFRARPLDWIASLRSQ